MIGAVILAAGRSQRMGKPKMVLSWGKTTVIGQVVSVFLTAEVDDVVVVTGGASDDVEAALKEMPVRTVFNSNYANEEMLLSLQIGLSSFSMEIEAALIALGDQPQVEVSVVHQVLKGFKQKGSPLVVPSYQMRRGHPWLLARPLWDALLNLHPPNTLRDFLNHHADQLQYVEVASPTILQDLDTPDDYRRYRPG